MNGAQGRTVPTCAGRMRRGPSHGGWWASVRPAAWLKAHYSLVFPAAFAFAHLALAAAESLALTSGLLRQSSLAGLGVANVPLTFAHLDLPAALMAALPAALIRLLPFLAAFNLAERIFRALARALMSLRRCAAVMWYLRLPGVGASSADGIGISPPPPAAIESIWP